MGKKETPAEVEKWWTKKILTDAWNFIFAPIVLKQTRMNKRGSTCETSANQGEGERVLPSGQPHRGRRFLMDDKEQGILLGIGRTAATISEGTCIRMP